MKFFLNTIRPFLPCLGVFWGLAFSATALVGQGSDCRVFEMRTYYAAPGKLDELHARFRDHTTALFAKHGMTNIGYWVPLDNKDNILIYLLAYPSREARDVSWKNFVNDPDWKKAFQESRVDGPLVEKVVSEFLQVTDYSPAIRSSVSAKSRVFELRRYTTPEGLLPNLNARFRDHTVKLFERHGMTNVGYWNMAPGQEGSEKTLVYILAHDSQDAAKQSFGTFRDDPDWQSARKASEEKAGGSLTIRGGVSSTFMRATDYSPIR